MNFIGRSFKRIFAFFVVSAQLWIEGPKYPYFHLLQSDIDYVFVSVTSEAKKEEFHDENRRLCDLHLFYPFLKLIEPNISTKQENILSSQIGNTFLAFFFFLFVFFCTTWSGNNLCIPLC